LWETPVFYPAFNGWLIKIDADGNVQWNKTIVTRYSGYLYSGIQTRDGGYAFVGLNRTVPVGMVANVLLFKTDSSGSMQWNKTYGGPATDVGFSLVQTPDSGYAVAAMTSSFGAGGRNGWLIKTDANGNMQWNKTYGGANNSRFSSISLTNDGGFALGGTTNSFGAGNGNMWFVKTDSYGNVQESKSFGGSDDGSGSQQDEKNVVCQTADGGYVLTGTTAGSANIYLVKVGVEGESGLAWTDSTANTITLYRGANDVYWNYVRVRVWIIR